MIIYWSKYVAYVLPCVIKAVVLTFKLVLQYVSKHFVMSSFKYEKLIKNMSLIITLRNCLS